MIAFGNIYLHLSHLLYLPAPSLSEKAQSGIGRQRQKAKYFYGTISNCYYNSDMFTGGAFGEEDGTATHVDGKTTAQFANGEVAYLLNGSKLGVAEKEYIRLIHNPGLQAGIFLPACNPLFSLNGNFSAQQQKHHLLSKTKILEYKEEKAGLELGNAKKDVLLQPFRVRRG